MTVVQTDVRDIGEPDVDWKRTAEARGNALKQAEARLAQVMDLARQGLQIGSSAWRMQSALQDILAATKPEEPKGSQVIDLMEVLKESLRKRATAQPEERKPDHEFEPCDLPPEQCDMIGRCHHQPISPRCGLARDQHAAVQPEEKP